MLLQEMDTAKDVPPLIRGSFYVVSPFVLIEYLPLNQADFSAFAVEFEQKKVPA
jgi:hypothetical protein